MTKPSRATPATMHTVPDTTAIMPASATARSGVAAGQRQHDGEDDRRQRGVRSQHQDPAGAEQRVGEQRNDGRVETVDAGHARRHGVGDADGHQHRRQHQPGHDVVPQPGDLVARSVLKPRQPAAPAVCSSPSDGRRMRPVSGGEEKKANRSCEMRGMAFRRAGLRDRLVVEVLRMVGLREEVPALGEQSRGTARRTRRRTPPSARPRGPRRATPRAARTRPARNTHLTERTNAMRPAVEELARVERVAHESLRLLDDARMLDADRRLQRRLRAQPRVARERCDARPRTRRR